MASHKVDHLKRYNHLESTRWFRLQVDWADSHIGVVQAAACETLTTLYDETVSLVWWHEDVFGHGNGNGKERSDDRRCSLLFHRHAALHTTLT